MKNIKFLMIYALIMLFFTGCSGSSVQEEDNNISENNNEIEEVDKIKDKVESMSLEEKIGQLFIVGFEGEEINSRFSKESKSWRTYIFFKKYCRFKSNNKLE